MCNVQNEYLKFGPWLTMIESSDDVPTQFEHVKADILGSSFSFKVPVEMDWREAQEGMLLYDKVISLTDEGICTHLRIDEAVFTTNLSYKDIVYMELTVNLLHSRLSLATSTETVSLNYNPVSQGIIEEFITAIRERYTEGEIPIELADVKEVQGVESNLYKYLVSQENNHKPTKTIAVQPFVTLRDEDRYLQDAVVLASDDGFIFFNRVKEVKDKGEVDYGYHCTFVPTRSIRDGEMGFKDIDSQVRQLIIKKGQATFRMTVADAFSLAPIEDIMMAIK